MRGLLEGTVKIATDQSLGDEYVKANGLTASGRGAARGTVTGTIDDAGLMSYVERLAADADIGYDTKIASVDFATKDTVLISPEGEAVMVTSPEGNNAGAFIHQDAIGNGSMAGYYDKLKEGWIRIRPWIGDEVAPGIGPKNVKHPA